LGVGASTKAHLKQTPIIPVPGHHQWQHL